jgi:hypothetical protein
MELLNGLTVQFIKVNLKMMLLMGKENLYIPMGINMKEIGFKIKLKELVNIQEQVEVTMKGVG